MVQRGPSFPDHLDLSQQKMLSGFLSTSGTRVDADVRRQAGSEAVPGCDPQVFLHAPSMPPRTPLSASQNRTPLCADQAQFRNSLIFAFAACV